MGHITPEEHDFAPVRGVEAIELVTELSRMAWSLTGQPLPSYSRATIPIRFVPRERRS